MRHRITEEEKIAKKLSDLLSNVTIDLDLVGRYLARSLPNVSYRRLDIVISSAEYEKEVMNDRANHHPLF
jgi:hypothetical protein